MFGDLWCENASRFFLDPPHRILLYKCVVQHQLRHNYVIFDDASHILKPEILSDMSVRLNEGLVYLSLSITGMHRNNPRTTHHERG